MVFFYLKYNVKMGIQANGQTFIPCDLRKLFLPGEKCARALHNRVLKGIYK